MAISFSQDQIIDRIKFENLWWESMSIDPYYSSMKKREYFRLFYPLVTESEVKRAVILMGPRRVGKTVLLFQAIDELIKSGVDSKHICYFSIETPIYNGISLEELLNLFLKINKLGKKNKCYVIFDEIQYLKDWEIHLKSLVDSYHNIKFVASGSAAAALKLKSNESGAGRFTDFVLPPLTFHEYLSLKGHDDLIISKGFEYSTTNIDRLNELFVDYINYGGYPEVSLSKEIQSDPGRFIKNDIIDKVLLRDLPSLYGIQDIQELNSLFTYIAYNSGNEMSLDEISKSSGVVKNTIKKYITYLEAAFLIKVIHRIDNNAKKFKRANFFKIYLTNPSLRSALFTPIDKRSEFIGNMVETAIFSQWNHNEKKTLYYARWNNGEVDMVSLDARQKPIWCLEIKWSNRYPEKISELKNFNSFCSKHRILISSITTVDIQKEITKDHFTYNFIPASIYCYTVGRNIVEGKGKRLSLITDK